MENLIKNIKHKFNLTDYSILNDIRNYIEEQIEIVKLDEIESQKIILAIDEICTNLIKHALNNFETTNDNSSINFSQENENKNLIEIKIEIYDNKIIFSIKDNTKAFNLTNLPITDMNNYFKLFKSGGLGVQIVKLVMDKIEYLPADTNNQYNELLLYKNLNYSK